MLIGGNCTGTLFVYKLVENKTSLDDDSFKEYLSTFSMLMEARNVASTFESRQAIATTDLHTWNTTKSRRNLLHQVIDKASVNDLEVMQKFYPGATLNYFVPATSHRKFLFYRCHCPGISYYRENLARIHTIEFNAVRSATGKNQALIVPSYDEAKGLVIIGLQYRSNAGDARLHIIVYNKTNKKFNDMTFDDAVSSYNFDTSAVTLSHEEYRDILAEYHRLYPSQNQESTASKRLRVNTPKYMIVSWISV